MRAVAGRSAADTVDWPLGNSSAAKLVEEERVVDLSKARRGPYCPFLSGVKGLRKSQKACGWTSAPSQTCVYSPGVPNAWGFLRQRAMSLQPPRVSTLIQQ